MAQARFDILGIGNAIVDVVAPVDEAFLTRHDMAKGAMTLIDAARADQLTAALPNARQSSGGSAANTCAVAAGLGARVAYIGRVADDALGRVFRQDIEAIGVHFPTRAATDGAPTARCLIAVTPDAQRTMNTYLGACVALDEGDVDADVVADAAITYLEGYLFDPAAAQAAFRRAADLAHKAGRRVALSLSDPFCADRHRDAFRVLVRDHIDILFANEAEVCSLYRCDRFEDAMEQARQDVDLTALTRSADGSVIVHGAETLRIKAASAKLVDSTGAGDAYAAGFLAALAAGRSLQACGELGSLAAAEIISHFGARPEADLAAMALSVA